MPREPFRGNDADEDGVRLRETEDGMPGPHRARI